MLCRVAAWQKPPENRRSGAQTLLVMEAEEGEALGHGSKLKMGMLIDWPRQHRSRRSSKQAGDPQTHTKLTRTTKPCTQKGCPKSILRESTQQSPSPESRARLRSQRPLSSHEEYVMQHLTYTSSWNHTVCENSWVHAAWRPIWENK